MTLRVWTEVSLQPDALARLRAKTAVVEHGTLENLAGCEVAIIGGGLVDDAFLDRAGAALKLIVRHGAGYNNVDVPAAARRGIPVANAPDAPTESTAEHTVALLLAAAKRIAAGDHAMRTNTPRTHADLRGTELRDLVLGIVGYGRIGRRVGEICRLGLNMHLLVYDPYTPALQSVPPGVQVVDSLEELLGRSDAVTLHTPLTPATHHLIGERELRWMKPGAYLINASRGPVVDEEAVIRVLQDGHLAGAGLDVFDPEPPRPDNPLLAMSNVVVTPHTGSNTPQAIWRMAHTVVDQVLQLQEGERPAHLIDPSVWPGRASTT